MIAANTRKRATFGRSIGILAIVDPPMLGRGVERVATALDVVIARDLILVDAAPVLVLPRALHVGIIRSEEHTSELQSLMRISYAVFCLKKKNKKIATTCIYPDIIIEYILKYR